MSQIWGLLAIGLAVAAFFLEVVQEGSHHTRIFLVLESLGKSGCARQRRLA